MKETGNTGTVDALRVFIPYRNNIILYSPPYSRD